MLTNKAKSAKILFCGQVWSLIFGKNMSIEHWNTTVDKIWDDNRSDLAKDQIREWQNRRDNTEGMVLIAACSDSRLILPRHAFVIRTVSAAGDRNPWFRALNYDKVTGIITVGHMRCGGVDTLVGIEEGRISVVEGKATSFVKDYVSQGDPVRHALDLASETAANTHKLVLGVVQDHHDGSIYPQGVYNNSDQVKVESVPSHLLMNKRKDIYAGGMPQLKDGLIPLAFRPSLDEIQENAVGLLVKYSDFREKQLVQDPPFVVITNQLKPLELRSPLVFGEPGTAFQVSLWRQMFEEADKHTKNKGVHEALRQVDYALSHCVEHNRPPYLGRERLAFKGTRVLYIETGSMDDSRKIASQAKDLNEDWLDLPGREIIYAEVVAGHIRDIDRAA